MLPILVQELRAVRKERHVAAGRIELARDLFRQGRYRKSSGALARDHKFRCGGKQFFAGPHSSHKVLVAVEIKYSLISGLPASVFAVLRDVVGELVSADVHVTGRICDDQEIPVVEGIIGPVSGDANIDVHDLCEQPQIVPVIVGKPGCDASAGHRPGGHVFIDRDASAGEKHAQFITGSFPDVNVIFRAVPALSLGNRYLVPDLLSGFADQDRSLLPQFIYSLCDGFLNQISYTDHPVLCNIARCHNLPPLIKD